jgi:hypothetical protein
MNIFNKIGVLSIVKDHYKTLENYNTQKVYYPDIFLFFIFPLIIAFFLTSLQVLLSDTIANALITSFSVFAALLFNLLLLVYDISGKPPTNHMSEERVGNKKEILKQIYINVSFSILISVIEVIVLILYFLKVKTCNLWGISICFISEIPPFLSFIVFYLTGVFVLTLLMILKRIYKLLSTEF